MKRIREQKEQDYETYDAAVMAGAIIVGLSPVGAILLWLVWWLRS